MEGEIIKFIKDNFPEYRGEPDQNILKFFIKKYPFHYLLVLGLDKLGQDVKNLPGAMPKPGDNSSSVERVLATIKDTIGGQSRELTELVSEMRRLTQLPQDVVRDVRVVDSKGKLIDFNKPLNIVSGAGSAPDTVWVKNVAGTKVNPATEDTQQSVLSGLTSIKSVDGIKKITDPVTVGSSALPSGAATSAKQDSQITEAQSTNTKLDTLNAKDLSTSAKQDTGNTSLSSIDTKLSSQATSTKQDTLIDQGKFNTNDIEAASSTVTYIGTEDKDGVYAIKKIDTSSNTVFTYATITNNPATTTYSSAWSNRASLTYNIYSLAF